VTPRNLLVSSAHRPRRGPRVCTRGAHWAARGRPFARSPRSAVRPHRGRRWRLSCRTGTRNHLAPVSGRRAYGARSRATATPRPGAPMVHPRGRPGHPHGRDGGPGSALLVLSSDVATSADEMQEGADRVLGSRHTRERWSHDHARVGRRHNPGPAPPPSSPPSETARRSPLPDGGPNGSAHQHDAGRLMKRRRPATVRRDRTSPLALIRWRPRLGLVGLGATAIQLAPRGGR
jgi:hypothetical protein